MTATISLDDHGIYVVVSGPPGSGKSTLARALAPRLRLPLLAKDTVKEGLLADLEVPDVAASRQVGAAAVTALLAVAADCGGGVLDSVWADTSARDRLRQLPGQIIEVFCRCDEEVARDRYAGRTGSRPAGFFDAERDPEELWTPVTSAPVDGGWPVIEVDTTAEVDVEALVERVLHAGDPAPAAPRWVVWRQDDLGNTVEVTRRDSQDVAQAVAEAMEATGHKQTYWVAAGS